VGRSRKKTRTAVAVRPETHHASTEMTSTPPAGAPPIVSSSTAVLEVGAEPGFSQNTVGDLSERPPLWTAALLSDNIILPEFSNVANAEPMCSNPEPFGFTLPEWCIGDAQFQAAPILSSLTTCTSSHPMY